MFYKKILICLSITFTAAFTSSLEAYPLFHYDLPPLGSAIGTQELSFIDVNRKDPHDKSFQGELIVRVWYPAIDDSKEKFAKWGYSKRDLILEKVSGGVPKFIAELVYQGEVRSKVSLPLQAGLHPIIFIFHGLGGGPIEEQTDLAETLANQGYIVLGVEFPFGAAISKISQSSEPIYPSKKLREILSRYPDSKPELIEYRKKEHELWVEDLLYLIKELKSCKKDFCTAMNWSEIHMLGHSHGGMVALDACLKEEFCKSSVNMDGWTYGLTFPLDLKKHLVIYTLSSGDYFRSFCKEHLNCKELEIKECDIGHSGFSDKAYFKWPFTYFTQNNCGSKTPEVKERINQEVIEFLKQT